MFADLLWLHIGVYMVRSSPNMCLCACATCWSSKSAPSFTLHICSAPQFVFDLLTKLCHALVLWTFDGALAFAASLTVMSTLLLSSNCLSVLQGIVNRCTK